MKRALALTLLLLAASATAADQPLARIGFSLGSETPAGAPLIGGQAVAQEMGDSVAMGDDTLVVWTEYRQLPFSIFAAAVAADGSRRHPSGVLIAPNAGDHASVATNGKLLIITWANPLSSSFTIARVRPDLTLIDTRSFGGSAWPTVASNGKTFMVAYGMPGQRVEAMLLDENGDLVTTTKIGPGVVPKIASNGDEYAIASYYSGGGGGGNVAVLDARANVLTARQLNAADVPNIAACGRRFFVASPTLSKTVDLVIVEGSSLIASKAVDIGRYAQTTALASNGSDVLLTISVRGTTDLVGIRLDANGTTTTNVFAIAADVSRYSMHSTTWNGSDYVVAWEWSDNEPINPKLAIRYALVRSDGVVPPPVLSGAQLTTPPGSMSDAQGAIDDSARLAVWTEANGRARYRIGNRDADLADNATIRGTAVGNKFAIVWSRGGRTTITLADSSGARDDVALPFGEITRASVAWDGSRFLIAAAGPSGVSFARVSAAGVLFELAPRVLDARAASAVAVTSVKQQFIVAATTTTSKRFLTYAIDGDSASVLAQKDIAGPTMVRDLAMTNDGTDAYLVSDTNGIARLSGVNVVWDRGLLGSFYSYGTPSVARIGNEFLAIWGHSTAARFDANGKYRETGDFTLIDAVVVQKPHAAAALLQRTFVNGAWLYVFRDVVTVPPKRRM